MQRQASKNRQTPKSLVGKSLSNLKHTFTRKKNHDELLRSLRFTTQLLAILSVFSIIITGIQVQLVYESKVWVCNPCIFFFHCIVGEISLFVHRKRR